MNMYSSSRKRDTVARCNIYQNNLNASSASKNIHSVLEEDEEEDEEENLAFVGGQYHNSAEQSNKKGSPHKKESPNKKGSPHKKDSPNKKELEHHAHTLTNTNSHKHTQHTPPKPEPSTASTGSNNKGSPQKPEPEAETETETEKPVSTQASRKAEAKKKAMEDYMRVVEEKKNKEQEAYLKHKAFLADVEARRRANIILNKAKKKQNAIFASQKNGLRKRFVAEWALLSEDQKISTRALRSRRNIKCEKCGTMGYFIEICPNNCSMIDSDDEDSVIDQLLHRPHDHKKVEAAEYKEKSEACEGFLWGTNTTYTHEAMALGREKIHRGNTKANLNPLKTNMRREQSALRGLDEGLPGYAFHSKAEDGYHRDVSEVTLHKVLRYVMRVMESVIIKNAEKLESEKDYDLFHPPLEKPGSNFYPKEIWDMKEHRDYLTQQAVKKDRALNQAHSHHGATRPDDATDAYFRGGTIKDTNALFHPNKKAGQSMHSKIGWKGSLATGDDLAIADPKMQAKVDAMEKLMQKQKAWTRVQKKAFENTNERYIHMWNIVKEEITKEHDREYRLLSCDVHSNLHETQRDVWVERLDASDRIISTLLKYKYINGSSEADYSLQCLQTWREELKQAMERKAVAPLNGQGHKGHKKNKKKKIKAKRMFAKMGLQQRAEDEDDTDEDGDEDASLASLSTLDTEARNKLANLGTSLSTSNKGGYKGLGFASEFEVVKEVDSYDCNAAITAALLTGGASSLFEQNDPKKGDKLAFKKTAKKRVQKKDGTERDIFKKLELKYKEPQHELDKRKMAEVEKKYAAVGMERNIRAGTNEDNSQMSPSLIPMHEVFSASRDDHIQSRVGEQIVLRARLSRTDGVTGYIGREYVPMYVRNTLFETNGTTEGGDQTLENMSKDSRYSAQMGRTMQSLEPSKHEQKHLSKKFKQSTQLVQSLDSHKEKEKEKEKKKSSSYKNLPTVQPNSTKAGAVTVAAGKKTAKIKF